MRARDRGMERDGGGSSETGSVTKKEGNKWTTGWRRRQ